MSKQDLPPALRATVAKVRSVGLHKVASALENVDATNLHAVVEKIGTVMFYNNSKRAALGALQPEEKTANLLSLSDEALEHLKYLGDATARGAGAGAAVGGVSGALSDDGTALGGAARGALLGGAGGAAAGGIASKINANALAKTPGMTQEFADQLGAVQQAGRVGATGLGAAGGAIGGAMSGGKPPEQQKQANLLNLSDDALAALKYTGETSALGAGMGALAGGVTGGAREDGSLLGGAARGALYGGLGGAAAGGLGMRGAMKSMADDPKNFGRADDLITMGTGGGALAGLGGGVLGGAQSKSASAQKTGSLLKRANLAALLGSASRGAPTRIADLGLDLKGMQAAAGRGGATRVDDIAQAARATPPPIPAAARKGGAGAADPFAAPAGPSPFAGGGPAPAPRAPLEPLPPGSMQSPEFMSRYNMGKPPVQSSLAERGFKGRA